MGATDRVGTVVGGRYEVLSMLGEGGMGAVYRARHTDLGTEVALKMIHKRLAPDEGMVGRFRREAQKAAELKHPGIVAVSDLGTDADGSPFMAMELLEGAGLEQLLVHGKIELEPAVELVAQALEALQHAHEGGVIHRDLKPANLFLAKDRARGEIRVKLLDFGIAKILEDDGPGMTKTGHAIGTVEYMAPEQLRSSKNVDPRADVYSMGVTLFELLTGKRPVDGESVFDVASKVMSGEVARQPDELRGTVPDPIVDAIIRALATDPAGRFASAGEFAAVLRKHLPKTSLDELLATRAPAKGGAPETRGVGPTEAMASASAPTISASGIARTKLMDGSPLAAPETAAPESAPSGVARTQMMDGAKTADVESPVAVAVPGRGPAQMPALLGVVLVSVMAVGAGVYWAASGTPAETEGPPEAAPPPTVAEPVSEATPDAGPVDPPAAPEPPLHAVVTPGAVRLVSVVALAQARAHRLFSDRPDASGSPHPWAGRTMSAGPAEGDESRIELRWGSREVEWIADDPGLPTEVNAIAREDGLVIVRLENVGDTSAGVDGEASVLLIEQSGGELRIRNIWRGTSREYWTGRAPAWTRMRRRG